jgi:hypothetical protein
VLETKEDARTIIERVLKGERFQAASIIIEPSDDSENSVKWTSSYSSLTGGEATLPYSPEDATQMLFEHREQINTFLKNHEEHFGEPFDPFAA